MVIFNDVLMHSVSVQFASVVFSSYGVYSTKHYYIVIYYIEPTENKRILYYVLFILIIPLWGFTIRSILIKVVSKWKTSGGLSNVVLIVLVAFI
jgi:hypothetical protein